MTDRDNLRLLLLLQLNQSPAYTADQEALRRRLGQSGTVATRDQVRTELAWLDNVGAIALRESGGVFIGMLGEEGLEHIQGARDIPGIRKPGPGELA
ncbi:hypothetical protein SAMN02949497_1629 [Methylomagnum ishizawai]|uniref:Uncharacterized protein n=1 Tax=Methylomagnum ishizawai TaxID=1760988 RepID=A0A1Y6CUI7_9GAMM|nr:hypothetical protein [Methylomagnum ishizawai]SMF94319.1 hypothetical protein SAMN02949497_1629 [Methylomagnum ishizawai]